MKKIVKKIAKKPTSSSSAKKVVKKVKKVVKKAAPELKPFKDYMNKSELINYLSDKLDWERSEVRQVLGELENIMMGSVHPKGAGEFMWPGLFKITLRKIPARKAGTLVRNPATGEMVKGKAKPASVRVKFRALSKIKNAALS
jgi:nucleoid DNA-binding protein